MPYLVKNGSWALKGTNTKTGINIFKIVGRQKPSMEQSRFETFKDFFTSRQCECSKIC